MFAWLSGCSCVCMHVCVCACAFLWLAACLFALLVGCAHVCLFVRLFVYLFVYLFICLLRICVFIHWCIGLLMCQFVELFTCLSTVYLVDCLCMFLRVSVVCLPVCWFVGLPAGWSS